MTIFDFVKTQDDVDSALENIRRLEEHLFEKRHEKDDVFEVLDTDFNYKFSELLVDWFYKHNVTKNTRPTNTMLQEALHSLKITLESVNSFRVTLAFIPTQKFISQMFQWVKTNLGENVVLDISHNEKMLGGAIVSYAGKYADYSLEKALPDVVAKINI